MEKKFGVVSIEMEDFIEKMNEMFEANSCTWNKRVAVDYAKNCNVVVVKVLGNVATMDVSALTDYGVMLAIMDKVREMYGE